MSLDEATVTWAYRLLLAREPESPRQVLDWCAAGLERLRQGLVESSEFAARAAGGYPRAPDLHAPAPEDAVRAMLALRDGAMPDPATVRDALRAGPDLAALREALLASPFLEPWLPRRDGPRRRVLRLGGAEFPFTGDTRDPEFRTAPGPAPWLEAALRALFPEGGAGLRAVDSGAGIGLGALAILAALPGVRLRAHEARLDRVGFLAVNLAGTGAEAVALPAPPAAALLAEAPPPALLRLAAPGALPEALAAPPGPAAIVLRLDLRAALLEDRLDPRAALRDLAARWPGAALLGDAEAPLPLAGEAALDAALHAAWDAPRDVVLAADPGWRARFRAP